MHTVVIDHNYPAGFPSCFHALKGVTVKQALKCALHGFGKSWIFSIRYFALLLSEVNMRTCTVCKRMILSTSTTVPVSCPALTFILMHDHSYLRPIYIFIYTHS